MRKTEKMLLLVGVFGTLVIFSMAFIDRWLYDVGFFRGAQTTTSVAADVEDNAAQPMSGGEAQPAFLIDPKQSEVSFTLGEMLGGEPKTVIGTTGMVSGTVYFAADAPQDVQVGEILIDTRGFATDNDFRNRAIHSFILETDRYPTISFVPTSINGLPDTITMGVPVSVEIAGNLTIKDVTHAVTFTAQVTPVSETELDGHAEALVTYGDFGISVPSAPRVADVDKEALLAIDFVALRSE